MQVSAERAHADGQMEAAWLNAAQAVVEHATDDPERARWHEMIVSDCVATARACRRWARDLSHGRTGAPR